MTDKVYPTKLTPPPAAAAVTSNTGPPKTSQLYNPNRPRPVYRPPQTRPGRSCSGRRCCCLCFLYTLISLLILILLAAVAGCIFYGLYHPKHPMFSLTSVRTTRFNLTKQDSAGFSHLNSRFDLTLTAKNPNGKKIIFVYDKMALTAEAGGVYAGNSTLAGFKQSAGNTTVLHSTVVSDSSRDFDSDAVSRLRNDLERKGGGFPVTVEMNTMVEVRLGKMKTKKVGLRVTCDRMKGFRPGKVPGVGTVRSVKCKVDLRIKIWKFTF